MTLNQAIEILKERQKFNLESCEGESGDYCVFVMEEAEAIDVVLKELKK